MTRCANIDLEKLATEILHLQDITYPAPVKVECFSDKIVLIESTPSGSAWHIYVKDELGGHRPCHRRTYCDEVLLLKTEKVVKDVIHMISSEKHIGIEDAYILLQQIISRKTEEAKSETI